MLFRKAVIQENCDCDTSCGKKADLGVYNRIGLSSRNFKKPYSTTQIFKVDSNIKRYTLHVWAGIVPSSDVTILWLDGDVSHLYKTSVISMI
jgi:hypothetical protein